MLDYLVTSRTRRTLLRLLWRDGVSGTAKELSGRADVAFAGAYRELKAMAEAGLAKLEWSDGRKVYSANDAHPMACVLRKLVNQPNGLENLHGEEPGRLRENLAFLGLPVTAPKTAPKRDTTKEELLAEAATLAQEDASVARTLPLLYLKYADTLDLDLLKHESWKRGNKHQVGFFLELAGHLGHHPRLTQGAQRFLDHRRKVPAQFFRNPSDLSRQVAETRTPELAKKWGWRMNMPLDAFASTYEKFADETVRA